MSGFMQYTNLLYPHSLLTLIIGMLSTSPLIPVSVASIIRDLPIPLPTLQVTHLCPLAALVSCVSLSANADKKHLKKGVWKG